MRDLSRSSYYHHYHLCLLSSSLFIRVVLTQKQVRNIKDTVITETSSELQVSNFHDQSPKPRGLLPRCYIISLLLLLHRFTRDHHLKTHMRLHTGEKPYHCSHCDRQFVQVANLRRHLRVHTGERPYTCEVCGAKFSDSNQLKAHVLIHRGLKPFECDTCQVRFRRRHHLMHHRCGTGHPSQAESRSQADAQSNASEEPENNAEPEAQSDESTMHSTKKIKGEDHQESSSMATDDAPPIPLDLSGIPVNLPEQTEPEDLSMSTRRLVSACSNTSGAGSSSTTRNNSPSSDAVQEDDETRDISAVRPSNLFPRQLRRKCNRRQSVSVASTSKADLAS